MKYGGTGPVAGMTMGLVLWDGTGGTQHEYAVQAFPQKFTLTSYWLC